MSDKTENSIDLLFGIIDGPVDYSGSWVNDKPKEFHRIAAIEYAFDSLEQYEICNHVQNRLVQYIQNHNENSSELFLSLRTLGYVGNDNLAKIIIERLNSKNPDIRYIALSSVVKIV